jgi:hypothetical protein
MSCHQHFNTSSDTQTLEAFVSSNHSNATHHQAEVEKSVGRSPSIVEPSIIGAASTAGTRSWTLGNAESRALMIRGRRRMDDSRVRRHERCQRDDTACDTVHQSNSSTPRRTGASKDPVRGASCHAPQRRTTE